MTTDNRTNEPTAEQVVSETLGPYGLIGRARDLAARNAVERLRANGLLSEGTPTEEQIEFCYCGQILKREDKIDFYTLKCPKLQCGGFRMVPNDSRHRRKENTMTEKNNLDNAQELLDSRLAVYGERVKNMTDVAKVFSGILGVEVRPDQVPLLMIGYKTVRASGTPDYEDNIKDIEGYALMFREIIGDDMISAVNTDEYLERKAQRADAKEVHLGVNYGVGAKNIFEAHPLEQAAQDHLAHLSPAQKIMAMDSVRMNEACVHCRSLDCDGDCELRKRERAYNSTLEPEIDEVLVSELTDRIERLYDQHNSFVYGHRAAAEVAAAEAERFYAKRSEVE